MGGEYATQGLSPAASRQAANLQPGTRLLRDWQGERYEVLQEDGFLYDGKKYRRLNAVARAITGSYWSGSRFFGLTPNSKKEGRQTMTAKRTKIRCAIYA